MRRRMARMAESERCARDSLAVEAVPPAHGDASARDAGPSGGAGASKRADGAYLMSIIRAR